MRARPLAWLLAALSRRGASLHGWKLQRVLTDRCSKFKGLFDALCSELGVHHTRTKPRDCSTNGLVERLQGTIFHEQ